MGGSRSAGAAASDGIAGCADETHDIAGAYERAVDGERGVGREVGEVVLVATVISQP